jgi:hypothetical protein
MTSDGRKKNLTTEQLGREGTSLGTYFHECLGIVAGPLTKITAVRKPAKARERRG